MVNPFRWAWGLMKEMDRGMGQMRDLSRRPDGLPLWDAGVILRRVEAECLRGEDGGFAARFELPGVDLGEVEVGVREANVLTVTGSGQCGVFCGSVTLPEGSAGSLRAVIYGEALWVTVPDAGGELESYPVRVPVERV